MPDICPQEKYSKARNQSLYSPVRLSNSSNNWRLICFNYGSLGSYCLDYCLHYIVVVFCNCTLCKQNNKLQELKNSAQVDDLHWSLILRKLIWLVMTNKKTNEVHQIRQINMWSVSFSKFWIADLSYTFSTSETENKLARIANKSKKRMSCSVGPNRW